MLVMTGRFRDVKWYSAGENTARAALDICRGISLEVVSPQPCDNQHPSLSRVTAAISNITPAAHASRASTSALRPSRARPGGFDDLNIKIRLKQHATGRRAISNGERRLSELSEASANYRSSGAYLP